MKLNPKNIIVGGIVFYLPMMIVGMAVFGPTIHEGVLEPIYRQTQEFWRPELNEVPPNVEALMLRWVTVGLLMSFLFAGIYDNIRSAFDGSGVVKGLKYGIMLGLFTAAFCAAYSGVFNLPDMLWFWWSVEALVNYAVGGAVLGWFIGKWGTD